jgi:hypothetical protein
MANGSSTGKLGSFNFKNPKDHFGLLFSPKVFHSLCAHYESNRTNPAAKVLIRR